MVEEEGEVFRKGHVLLTPKEMEGEYDGEELRMELLEAEVERPPPHGDVLVSKGQNDRALMLFDSFQVICPRG